MVEISEIDGAVLVLVRTKQLQMFGIPEFKAATSALLAKKPGYVIFDMGNVQSIDSSGLGALFNIQKALQAHGGRSALINIAPRITQILKVTGSDTFLKVFNSVDEALKGA